MELFARFRHAVQLVGIKGLFRLLYYVSVFIYRFQIQPVRLEHDLIPALHIGAIRKQRERCVDFPAEREIHVNFPVLREVRYIEHAAAALIRYAVAISLISCFSTLFSSVSVNCGL